MAETKQRRGQYPKQKLQQAIAAVIGETMTSIKASEVFEVPRSTIRTHLNKPSTRIGAGRSQYLNEDEEAHLVELIKSLEKIGVRVTRPALLRVSGQYLRRITKDPRFQREYSELSSKNTSLIDLLEKMPSLHWLRDFLGRNKKLIKMVREKKMERNRRHGFTEDVRTGWFSTLKEILAANDLMYKPLQIWNMDESGFSDDTQSESRRDR
jgi:predicted transcriptional regulator